VIKFTADGHHKEKIAWFQEYKFLSQAVINAADLCMPSTMMLW